MYRAYFVDDEPLVMEEFAYNPIFSDNSYQVVGLSADPQLAIGEIRRLSPDVVFTDLKMPGMSGIDMMEQLRSKGAACEFVVISAYPDFEETRRFFLLDGFDYLIKPVSGDDLQELITRLSARLAGKRELADCDAALVTPSPELNKAIAYISENLAAKHTLVSVARKCFTNPTYLSKLFSNYLATTFTAYLTRLRMEEAARLLRDTQKDVKEISALCGYGDYFYFCRVFRRIYSCTPTAFREGAKSS